MTLLGMITRKVDPFAVYAAERQLAAHGLSVPRNVLISHYLVRGQLRTAVRRVIEDVPRLRVDQAMAAAIAEGPDESRNPKFVSPVRTGLLYCGAVFVLVAVVAVFKLAAFLFPLLIDWRWPVLVVALLTAACFGYAFLGSRLGREKARPPVMLLFGLGAAGIIYVVIQRFGVER